MTRDTPTGFLYKLFVIFVVFPHFSKAFTSTALQEFRATELHSKNKMEGWTTLEPISFHKVAGDHQYAKDDNYMQAVLELWEKELNGVFVQTRPFLYHADDKETPLFGQVVCRRKDHVTRPVPGILLFHTAAGPKDIFMFYKAAMLIQQFDCVVFICDIMSDETGWGWDSVRTRYTKTRESLLRNDARLLQARVLAACKALCVNDGDFLVDPQRLAAMVGIII